jgi:hypothetical protein
VISIARTRLALRSGATGVTLEAMFARNGENGRPRPVTGITLFAGRIRWYLRALGFHPLVRTVDRLEALAVLGVLIVGILAIPAASSAGTLIHDAGVRLAEEQALDRHSVQTLVVAGVGLPMDLDTPAYVHAQWQDGTRTRTESIVAPATVKPGDHLTIWLDDDSGKVVAAPMRVGDAELNGIAAAVSIWVSFVMFGVLGAYFVRRGLDRSRDRAWERELELFAHNDDGWANRQT